jgi:hypothetical protein
MIEIEGPDGVIYEFPEGTSEDVMRTALMKVYGGAQPAQSPMQERIEAAKAGTLQMQPGSAERAAAADATALQGMGPERTMAETLYENIVGSGDVDTIGERLGQLIRGGGAATARGMADVPALPANLLQLGAMGVEKALGMEEPSMVSRALEALPDTRGLLASVPVIGPESEYKAPGTAGEFISTAGEFAGGAGLMGGLKSMLQYGVIPGLASEGAGQLTEGTSLEPYARTAAAIMAALIAGKPGKFAGDSESARLANKLESEGVKGITAGQAKGSTALMRMEGRLAPTADQVDDFTASTLRRFGSAEKTATPNALRSIETDLVKRMDDAVSGVEIMPQADHAANAAKVAVDYADRVPAGLTPRGAGIAKEIRAMWRAEKPIPLERLKAWRSDIGSLTVSPDAATREAAHQLRTMIDDMTDSALVAAGREKDIAKLATAREAYRDYIGVRDAASRAGAETGTLSPTQLNQSMIRSQGREAYATGRTTPMTDFTRAGAAILRPAPSVMAGGQRSITDILPLIGGAIGGAGGLAAGNPMLGALGAAAGLAAPATGQAIMRSPPVQAMLRDPTGQLANTLRTLPGLLGN